MLCVHKLIMGRMTLFLKNSSSLYLRIAKTSILEIFLTGSRRLQKELGYCGNWTNFLYGNAFFVTSKGYCMDHEFLTMFVHNIWGHFDAETQVESIYVLIRHTTIKIEWKGIVQNTSQALVIFWEVYGDQSHSQIKIEFSSVF